MRVNGLGDSLRETLTIDREGRTRGNTIRVGRLHDQRAKTPHLFLEQADGVVQFVAAERVRTDQLAEPIGLVHRGRMHGTDRLSELVRSEEHTSELQSLRHLVCRLLLEKKKTRTE